MEQMFQRTRNALFGASSDDPNAIAYEMQGAGAAPQGFLDDFDSVIGDLSLSGLYNGVFRALPTLGLDTVLDAITNILPGFGAGVFVSGTTPTPTVTADASSPSGHNLRWTFVAGTASDESYVEQVVVIGGSFDRIVSVGLRVAFVNHSATQFTGTIEGQFLTISKSTTGSAFSATQVLAGGASDWERALSAAGIPSDAYYLRIRVGAKRGTTATSATGSIDIASVRVERFAGALYLPDTTPANPPIALANSIGRFTLTIVGEAANWVAFDSGASGGRSLFLGDGTNVLDTRIYRLAAGIMATGGAPAFPNYITPGSMGSAAVDDYAPTDGHKNYAWYISSGAAVNLRGIDAGSGGEEHLLINEGSFAITTKQENTNSVAANRFYSPDYVLSAGGSVRIHYSARLTRWVVSGH